MFVGKRERQRERERERERERKRKSEFPPERISSEPVLCISMRGLEDYSLDRL